MLKHPLRPSFSIIGADFCIPIYGNIYEGYLSGDIVLMVAKSHARNGEFALVRDTENRIAYLGYYNAIVSTSEENETDQYIMEEVTRIEIWPNTSKSDESLPVAILHPDCHEVLGVAVGRYTMIDVD